MNITQNTFKEIVAHMYGNYVCALQPHTRNNQFRCMHDLSDDAESTTPPPQSQLVHGKPEILV